MYTAQEKAANKKTTVEILMQENDSFFKPTKNAEFVGYVLRQLVVKSNFDAGSSSIADMRYRYYYGTVAVKLAGELLDNFEVVSSTKNIVDETGKITKEPIHTIRGRIFYREFTENNAPSKFTRRKPEDQEFRLKRTADGDEGVDLTYLGQRIFSHTVFMSMDDLAANPEAAQDILVAHDNEDEVHENYDMRKAAKAKRAELEAESKTNDLLDTAEDEDGEDEEENVEEEAETTA